MNTYLHRVLIRGEDPATIHEHIRHFQEERPPEQLHNYLGISRAELELFERDQSLFYRYFATTRATRKGGCG